MSTFYYVMVMDFNLKVKTYVLCCLSGQGLVMYKLYFDPVSQGTSWTE